MIKTFYCFRHGQTDWNKEHKLQGCQIDLSLNETGRSQAKEIPHFDIDVIYTSPLKRASETAEIYNIKHNVEIIKDDSFKEVSYGELTGKTLSELGLSYEEIISHHIDPDNKKQNVKDFKDSLKRISLNSDKTKIGIFSHGGILDLLAKSLSDKKRSVLKNSEYLTITYNKETDELILVE